jgi:hypothetical protein
MPNSLFPTPLEAFVSDRASSLKYPEFLQFFSAIVSPSQVRYVTTCQKLQTEIPGNVVVDRRREKIIPVRAFVESTRIERAATNRQANRVLEENREIR